MPGDRHGPWRRPAEETEGLYPHLVVVDNVQSGSITFGRTRLPIWAPCWAVDELEDYVQDGDPIEEWRTSANSFVFNLLNMRGEFARLLLVLADAERSGHHGGRAWWDTKRHRKRIGDQLQRCLAVLDPTDPAVTSTGRDALEASDG